MSREILSVTPDVNTPKKFGMKEILMNILQPNSKRDEAYKSILPYLLRIEGRDDAELEKYITSPEDLLSPKFLIFMHATNHAFSSQKPRFDASKIDTYFEEQQKKGGKNTKQQKNIAQLRIYIEEVKNLEENIAQAFASPDMQTYLNMKNMNKESLPQDPKFLNVINHDIVGNIKNIKTKTKRILEIFETTWGKSSYQKYLMEVN